MTHQKACDRCGEKMLDITFHLPEDEVRFIALKELPGPFSFHQRTMLVEHGKVFYLSQFGFAVVVCEKCLEDGDVIRQMANEPRLIEKAINNLLRGMAEGQSLISRKIELLRESRKQALELEEEIRAGIESLSERGKRAEHLIKKLSESEVLEES